jgi:hypothetical protein
VKYGLGVLATTVGFAAHKWGVFHAQRYDSNGRKLTREHYSDNAQGL